VRDHIEQYPKFNAKERAVLDHVVLGCSNDEIAYKLRKSLGWVKKIVSALLRTTQTMSRAQLIAWAVAHPTYLPERKDMP